MRALSFLLFAALPGPKQFNVNGTLIQRFVDDEAGVVCYLAHQPGYPQALGISCVKP
jgi:hypothetical protein